jgi:2-keto-4-pentenoate hydratase/2-oxohepta-3-ene-1,7-dioic acid hydratase in catechol pathway
LRISTTLNGQVMQDAPTADMLFPPARLLAFLTDLITLEAGDVVTTGSPAGVGSATARCSTCSSSSPAPACRLTIITTSSSGT